MKKERQVNLEKDGLVFPITYEKYQFFFREAQKKENKKRTYNIVWDAYQIYNHLIFTGMKQETNQPWANNTFMKNGLNLTEDRIKEAKTFLIKVGLIEIIKGAENKKSDGKFGKTYTKVITRTPLSIQNESCLKRGQAQTGRGLNGEQAQPVTAQTGIIALGNKLIALGNNSNNISKDILGDFQDEEKIPKYKFSKPDIREKLKKETIENIESSSTKTAPKENLKKQVLPQHSIVEFWNSIALRCIHKRTNSQVYQNAVVHFEDLLAGRFGSDGNGKKKKKFRDDKLKGYAPLINKKWTLVAIKQTLEDAALYFIDGYWPEKKDIAPKDLPSLIFNPHTGNSWFLDAALKPPQPIHKTKIVKPKNPEIFEWYENLFREKKLLKNKEDENKLIMTFNDLYTEVRQRQIDMNSYMKQTSFSSHIGSENSPKPFFRQHVEWLRKQKSINIFAMKTNGNWYNSFIGYLKQLHGFNLYPDETEKARLQESFRKEMAIPSRVYDDKYDEIY